MKAHPAAELFPLLTGQQLDELVADIRDNGQRVPIVVHDGMILDGRNRWRACELLEIEPILAPWDRVGSPIAFVVSVNLLRRHLDESQRAMIAARLKPMFEEEARKRQGARNDLLPNISANLREGSKAAADAAALVQQKFGADVEWAIGAIPNRAGPASLVGVIAYARPIDPEKPGKLSLISLSRRRSAASAQPLRTVALLTCTATVSSPSRCAGSKSVA